jgi:hypothetical protein
MPKHGPLLDAVVQMFGLQAVFGPGIGETKKASIMDFLKNAIGVGELALGKDIVDQTEFVAGLDQAAEGVLRPLKATHSWQKSFGPAPDRLLPSNGLLPRPQPGTEMPQYGDRTHNFPNSLQT